MPRLTVLSEENKGLTYPILGQTCITLGRDPHNSFVIPDNKLSREHAKIVLRNGEYLLIDCDSAWGTFLNGKQIKESLLGIGDRITLGKTVILFTDDRDTLLSDKSHSMVNFVDEDIFKTIEIKQQTDSALKNLFDTEMLTHDIEKLTKAHKKLSILYSLGNTINSMMNQQEVFIVITDLILQIINADRGFILLIDEETQELVEKGFKRRDDTVPENAVNFSKTLAYHCIEKKVGLIFPDPDLPSRFKEGESILLYNIKSAMCAPLKARNKVLGILYVDSIIQNHTFSSDDLDLLSAISNQAAIAIENFFLYELAVTDGLTHIYVHRYFQKKLADELERAKRYRQFFSLLLLDIDHFKSFNDHFGHQTGDYVLAETARLLKQDIRIIDTLARYGGEEFALILPEVNEHDLISFAERLREKVEQHQFITADNQTLRITVSIGGTTCKTSETLKINTTEPLVKRADEALYQAKAAGRNRVCFQQ